MDLKFVITKSKTGTFILTLMFRAHFWITGKGSVVFDKQSMYACSSFSFFLGILKHGTIITVQWKKNYSSDFPSAWE